MKKFILTLVTISFLGASLMAGAAAADKADKAAKKEKAATAERTIKGMAVCTKCQLKETAACGLAIQVVKKNKAGEETKSTIYVADNDVAKAFGMKACKEAQSVTAKGMVKKEGSRSILTATQIEVVQPKAKGKKKA